MTESVVRAFVDTFVDSVNPTKNYAGGTWLRVKQNSRETLLRVKMPTPAGVTVLKATLTLTQVDRPASGAITATVQRTTTAPNLQVVRWNNKPASAGNTAALTKNGQPAGTLWAFDVTALVQDIANGSPNNGWRITSNSTTELHFYAGNSTVGRPVLDVIWTTAPAAPTILRPSHGAVSVSKPVLSCDYTDHSGSTELTSMQVQIDAANDFTHADWDSGEVFVDAPQLDLSTTSYPGLVAGASTYWRVRVRDGDGLWSAWSDSAQFTNAAIPSLQITNPAGPPNNFVTEFTPPILWSYSGTQVHYRVMVAQITSPTVYVYDSGKIADSANGITIPAKVLKNNRNYILTVRVWDGVTRESTVGLPAYAEQQVQFQVLYDPTVDGVDSTYMTQTDGIPWVDVHWTRAQAADSYTILRDDEAIAVGLEAADVVQPDGSSRWRDHGARPMTPHTYQVRAVVNGRLSPPNDSPIVNYTPVCFGVFIVDPVNDQYVVLGGRDKTETADDQAQLYPLLGSSTIVRQVTAVGGLAGQFPELMIRDRNGKTWETYEDRLNDYKGRPTDTFRLIYGDMNIPVVLGNIAISPHESTGPYGTLKLVSFSWWQVDEFPFETTY